MIALDASVLLVRQGRGRAMQRVCEAMGIRVVVLDTAITHQADLATFDDALAAATRNAGLQVT